MKKRDIPTVPYDPNLGTPDHCRHDSHITLQQGHPRPFMQCVLCHRHAKLPITWLMGSIPIIRVQPHVEVTHR